MLVPRPVHFKFIHKIHYNRNNECMVWSFIIRNKTLFLSLSHSVSWSNLFAIFLNSYYYSSSSVSQKLCSRKKRERKNCIWNNPHTETETRTSQSISRELNPHNGECRSVCISKIGRRNSNDFKKVNGKWGLQLHAGEFNNNLFNISIVFFFHLKFKKKEKKTQP